MSGADLSPPRRVGILVVDSIDEPHRSIAASQATPSICSSSCSPRRVDLVHDDGRLELLPALDQSLDRGLVGQWIATALRAAAVSPP